MYGIIVRTIIMAHYPSDTLPLRRLIPCPLHFQVVFSPPSSPTALIASFISGSSFTLSSCEPAFTAFLIRPVMEGCAGFADVEVDGDADVEVS
jgi:hypothetical protein